MSYLSQEIERQMNAGKLNQTEIAEKSRLGQPMISRWINSEQIVISLDQLAALASALSKSEYDHALLYAAHARDEVGHAGNKLVEFVIRAPAQLKDATRKATARERALEYFTRESINNKHVCAALIAAHKVLDSEES